MGDLPALHAVFFLTAIHDGSSSPSVNMPVFFRETAILILLWMGATWFSGMLMLIGDTLPSDANPLTDARLWGGTLLGGATGAVFSPLFRAKWNRWYIGALFGLPVCGCILFAFFYVFPHSWQPTRMEAWKSTMTFLHVYPDILLPISLVTGACCTWLVQRTRTQAPSTR